MSGRLPAVLTAATTALLLAGCAPSTSSAPSSSTPANPIETIASSALPPASPKPSPSTPATAPAPSTAGDLSAESLPPEVLGFRAQERPPAEFEFVPNGTWVHAVEARQAAVQALPLCRGNAGWSGPGPEAALMGSYVGAEERPGNALALSFAGPAEATSYADTYRQVLASCVTTDGTSTSEIAGDTDWYAGRRDMAGTTWTELVSRRGHQVVLVIVQDDGRSADVDVVAAAQGLAH